jgi:hypothetical protein
MGAPANPMNRRPAAAPGVGDRRARSVRSARVVALEEVWERLEEEFMEVSASRAEAGCDDIAVVRDSGRVPVFAAADDATARGGMRADAVRRQASRDRGDGEDRIAHLSRPTSLATFSEAPFLLSAETVEAAVARFAGDQAFADIQQVSASDGTMFLYSSNHLTPAHARSLAEWIAVERDLHW